MRLERAFNTKGSEDDEDLMWQARARSKALMITGFGNNRGINIIQESIDEITARQGIGRERTFQTISKS